MLIIKLYHKKIVVVLLIKISILANGILTSANKIHSGDIDEFHQKSYSQILTSESFVDQDQRNQQEPSAGFESDDESDIYNHHNRHNQLDETEFADIPRHNNDDKSSDQQPLLDPTSATVLSENVTSGHMTSYTDITSGSSEQNEMIVTKDRISLTREFITKTCQLDRGSQRSEQLNNTFLTYCSRYKLENLLSNEILMSIMHHESRDCEGILHEFVQLDETINQFDNLFIKLLSRYNCHNGYSVKWNCDDCKKAYKDWLCATHLPFYMNGERIKPCISFCERVEQRCPYLHPITREQYGGQPVFICRDPNIPFVPEITPDIPYSEPGKCYDLCHLSDNLTELIIDSLSRYDHDKCPDRAFIAGEVRNEQVSSTSLSNQTRPPISGDFSDYVDTYSEENAIAIANGSDPEVQTKLLRDSKEHKTIHVHNKKLEELREVLANYKNQAKTHRYHADHSSIDGPEQHDRIHVV